MTLTEALATRGITYERDEYTAADQRMAWRNAQGQIFARFTADEGWEWLREQREHERKIYDAAFERAFAEANPS